MALQAIQETIAKLRKALDEANDLQPETRTSMQAELDRLEVLLSNDKLPPDELQSAGSQLQQLLLTFETKHPQVTGLIAGLAESLANLGI
ncbi:MAG: DUF4404 family protein [Planctomycetales bacterium]|nr:DUF4404 family protein [Planctomycetales bacterium]